MAHKIVSATEFKAKCLALLDEVGQRGATITVTKRGRPVATVKPPSAKPWDSLRGKWKGKVRVAPGIESHDFTHRFDVLKKD
jgi:prevent-host-death family protein